MHLCTTTSYEEEMKPHSLTRQYRRSLLSMGTAASLAGLWRSPQHRLSPSTVAIIFIPAMWGTRRGNAVDLALFFRRRKRKGAR